MKSTQLIQRGFSAPLSMLHLFIALLIVTVFLICARSGIQMIVPLQPANNYATIATFDPRAVSISELDHLFVPRRIDYHIEGSRVHGIFVSTEDAYRASELLKSSQLSKKLTFLLN